MSSPTLDQWLRHQAKWAEKLTEESHRLPELLELYTNLSFLIKTYWCKPNRRSIKHVSCPYYCKGQNAGPPMPSKAKTGIIPSQMPENHPRHIQKPAMGTAHHITRDQATLKRHSFSHSEGGSTPIRVAMSSCMNARAPTAKGMSLWLATRIAQEEVQ